MNQRILAASCLLLVLSSIDRCFPADKELSPESMFATQILSVFREKCFSCHGEDLDDIRGEFDMRSLAGLLQGGESGEPSVVTGRPESSPLFMAVSRTSDDWSAMPPKENDRLSAEQIDWIKQWIAAGAPWPSRERIAELRKEQAASWDEQDGVSLRTSGGLSDEWTNRRYELENLWAYQPLESPVDTGDASGNDGQEAAINPIDAMINARLAELELDAAPPATRLELVRRATFDLTGLPPTPEQIDRFLNDPASDEKAFAHLVDRLLDSPHYGEQWARHWLDVVRYADSSGYANDYERGNAWRYRDYVIRAFNNDKPYDQFIIEQIAGDEILESTKYEEQRAKGEKSGPVSSFALRPSSFISSFTPPSELLIAVGFLRMGPWELTGMEVAKVARQRFLDDVTDSVGQVFLGHALRCARCHDHKFDPVPTRDYYSIQAAFATTQLAERRADFLPEENTSGFEERKYLEQRLAFYQKTLKELNEKRSIEAAREWYAANQIDARPFEETLAQLQSAKRNKKEVKLDEVRREMSRQKLHPDLIPPRHVGFEPRDFGLERISRKGMERLKWRHERYEPIALSVYAGRTPIVKSVNAPQRVPDDRMDRGELERTCILTGGDPFSSSDPVSPGVLSVIPMSFTDDGRCHHDLGPESKPPISGRRLALAKWIASKENPLTARVIVNRVWQWHFGQAIAGNPNNFGATGKKPTHPRLLNWLAARFIQDGWSIKTSHRVMMNSNVYRRSTRHARVDLLAERDPLGTSYAVFQPRRLAAEELRDAMLATTGELNREVGGIPARPEMDLEAALQPRQVMGTFAEAWQPSRLPDQRHRRSIYALRIRGLRDPFMEVFNSPSSDLSCEARENSTVTPQVFALFNSSATYERALAFANRLVEEGKRKGQRPKDEGNMKSQKEATVGAESPGPTNSDAPKSRHRSEIVRRAFELALGRPATASEVKDGLAHWSKMEARHQQLTFPKAAYPREVVREAVEENTGERFRFREPLEVYGDFVPDLKPADASPSLRGLAELCLVLFNCNEFAYVY